MTVKETILEETLGLFQKEGIEAYSEEELRNKLDISQATHKNLLKNAGSAIEEILILLQDGIKNINITSPAYIIDLQQHYGAVWNICLNHLNTYSYHQIYDILNRGVQEGEFRKDINLQLVTKIILEMVGLLLNPQVFPPDRYNLAEVYRSIYLYYIRGICTETGSKKAEGYFSTYTI
jgi:hypothetical protein